MRDYYTELNNVIILHAISNVAEEDYSEKPESTEAEKAFDETYKAEWETVENLVKAISPEFGGKAAARAAIWKYVDKYKRAYRDDSDNLTISLDDLHRKTADIARKYYTPDMNAVYLHNGVEYVLGTGSFSDEFVHFVGFSKHENLFIPFDNLGSFLPGVASKGLEIIKKAV